MLGGVKIKMATSGRLKRGTRQGQHRPAANGLQGLEKNDPVLTSEDDESSDDEDGSTRSFTDDVSHTADATPRRRRNRGGGDSENRNDNRGLQSGKSRHAPSSPRMEGIPGS